MNGAIPTKRTLTSFFAALLVTTAATGAFAGGIPEPGVTLHGQVLADDGSLVTQGRLVWTYASYDPDQPVVVRIATDLALFTDTDGREYSYRVHIPAEMPVPGKAVSAHCLPATESPIPYAREARLDGAFTTIIENSVNTVFGYADRGRTERVDLVTGIGGPPDMPSVPSPADAAMLVPFDVILDWDDAARAETYDLYLWSTPYPLPAQPTAVGLTSSHYQPLIALQPDADYSWQVIAHNEKGNTAGPVWTFRTAFAGDLQKLLDYLLGKYYLTFAEQQTFDLNLDGNLDIADFIMGLKRTVHLMQLSDDSAVEPAAIDKPPAPSSLLTGPRSIRIGSQRVLPVGWSHIYLPVEVLPDCVNAAGMNFRVELDPAVVRIVTVHAATPRANEDLHFYSPRSGAMNIVFFANPVQSLSASTAHVLTLELLVTPPDDAEETLIDVTAAALSDFEGASAPEVTGEPGHIYFKSTLTESFDWSLYP
jgi:hypothetical protein